MDGWMDGGEHLDHTDGRGRWLEHCTCALMAATGVTALGVALSAAPLVTWAADVADGGAWRSLMTAANAAAQRDDHADAAIQFDHAVKAAETFGPNDARLANALYGLGRAHRALYDYALAEQSYARALVIVESTPVENVSRSDVLDGLGDVYRMQGRYQDAEAAFKRSLALLEAAYGDAHPLVARALTSHLASLYRVQGRFDEAAAAYVRALAILEKTVPMDDKRLGLALIDLGEWNYERQRYSAAEYSYCAKTAGRGAYAGAGVAAGLGAYRASAGASRRGGGD